MKAQNKLKIKVVSNIPSQVAISRFLKKLIELKIQTTKKE